MRLMRTTGFHRQRRMRLLCRFVLDRFAFRPYSEHIYIYIQHIYIYICIYPIALRASPATVPGKRNHYRVFFQKCLAALGSLPAKCVTGYSEMMRTLSQSLFGVVMLGTLPGNRVQK